MLYLQMPKNNYLVARTLLNSGEIKTVSALLEVLDKTPFSRDAKTTPERFNRMLDNLALFRFGDVANMAQVLGVDEEKILDLFYKEYVKRRKKKG